MTKNLKVGVIGTGLFARQCHIAGIQSHGQAEVTALASRSAAPLKETAALFGIRNDALYQDYRDMLEKADLDAVSIVTPDSTHFAIAMEALERGLHVLLEKPLAMDSQQARMLMEKSRAKKKVNMVAFTFRYTEAMRKLRSLLDDGLIGVPVKASIEANWGELLQPASLSWREDKSLSAGGIWADAGAHLFDALSFTLGDVSELCCRMATIEREKRFAQPTTADFADCIAIIESDRKGAKRKTEIQVQMSMSRISRPLSSIHEFQITGTDGSLGISMTRGNDEYINHLPAGGDRWLSVELPKKAYDSEPDALKRMMHSFLDSCIEGKATDEFLPSFEDGWKAQVALDAGAKSSKSREWTRLNYAQELIQTI